MKPNPEPVIHAIRYQVFTPRVTTWGRCSRQCGMGARGAAVCAECLTADLAKLCGATLAYRLLSAMREVQQTLYEIEDATVTEDF